MVSIFDLGPDFEAKLSAGRFLRPDGILHFESVDEATTWRMAQSDSRRYSYPIFHRDGETIEVAYEQRNANS